jgi:uncharacterized Zn finger protein (UPF0148 family)
MSDLKRCCGSVRPAGSFRSYQCGVSAKFEHDGKHYCGRHHPPTVKARQEKKRDEWSAKYEYERNLRNKALAEAAEQKRRAECFPDLLEAVNRLLVCMSLANWENDDAAVFARAALAKATQ